MKRNHFLDVIKGVCILLVILTHFDWVESERLTYLFPYWMNPAVPMFMILSGYVYTESFQRKKVESFQQAYNKKGIIDKIIRYTVPLVMVYIIEIPLRLIMFPDSLDVWMVIQNFFLGGFGPGSYYYQYMIQFIFLFPLIYFAIKKWDFNGLVLCGLANIAYELIKIPLHIDYYTFRLLVFRYIFAIALGCYFSMGKKKLTMRMGVASFVIGVVFIAAVCYARYQPVVFYRWARTSMMAVFYIAPIAYLLIKKCSFRCKPLEILGQASYNIFFVQMVFFHLVGNYVGGIPGTFWPMLGTYAVCIILGLLFYKIETPITKKILAWNANRLANKS